MKNGRQRSTIALLDVPYKIRETGVPQSKYIEGFSSPVRLLTAEKYKYLAEQFPGEKILDCIYFYLGSYKSPMSSIFNVYYSIKNDNENVLCEFAVLCLICGSYCLGLRITDESIEELEASMRTHLMQKHYIEPENGDGGTHGDDTCDAEDEYSAESAEYEYKYHTNCNHGYDYIAFPDAQVVQDYPQEDDDFNDLTCIRYNSYSCYLCEKKYMTPPAPEIVVSHLRRCKFFNKKYTYFRAFREDEF